MLRNVPPTKPDMVVVMMRLIDDQRAPAILLGAFPTHDTHQKKLGTFK